ncbi:MAG: M48 family metalloprotease [Microthrixaceae bacterium]|nr:M48 family metalloprotease [Microthrixaceae bacterium]
MTPLATMLDERARANRAAISKLRTRSALPPAALVAVVAAVLVALPTTIVVGVVVGLAVGVALGWWRRQVAGDRAVGVLLELLDARPATEEEFPRYLNLVEGLSITTGIEQPTLYVVDDPAANAAALGAGANAALVLTTGLLGGIGRVELEGVLAEELARIRVLDADVAARGALLAFGPLLRRSVTTDSSSGPEPGRGKSPRLATVLDGRRHFIADMSASSMTRYPPGLRDALVKMQSIGTAVSGVTWGTAHLWMCNPLPLPDGDQTDHPPLQHRIDLLAEL